MAPPMSVLVQSLSHASVPHLVQEIIAAAADEAGEWYLPLTAAQVKLRTAH